MASENRIPQLASLASDLCLGAAVGLSVVGLGGFDLRLVPATWSLLLAAAFLRWLDLRSSWSTAVAWALPFLAWVVVRAGSSPMEWEAWREVEIWIQGGAVLALASSARKPWRSGWLLASAGVLACGAALWQLLLQPGWLPGGRVQAEQYWGRASGTFGNPNSLAAFLLLLAGPFAGLAADRSRDAIRRSMGAYGAAVAVIVAVLTMSRGVALAAFLVGLVSAWASGRRRLALLLLIATSLVVGLVPPLRMRFQAAVDQRGESARAVIWPATVQAALEKPWAGWGGGTFGVAFETRRPPGFADQPERAHNELLQVWQEHGAAGVCLSLLFVAGFWIHMRRSPRRSPVATGSLLALAAFGVACLFDHHLRVPALVLVAAWVAGSAWAAQRRSEPALGSPQGEAEFAAAAARRRYPPMSGAPQVERVGRPVEKNNFLAKLKPLRQVGTWAGIGITALLVGAAPGALSAARVEKVRAASFASVRQQTGETPQDLALFHRVAERARDDLRGALASSPDFAQGWADLSALELLAVPPDSPLRPTAGGAAARAARTALRLSDAPAEFWVRLGNALQAEGRPDAAAEAAAAFREALRRAPRSALVWYHYAYFLASRPGSARLALVAIEKCLQLDPSHRPAQRLRERLSSLE
ncbi:MAG: O-antigen ligase family protein [Opitutaceae bacterium]|nr:O-antigen ligase family protein [Opitutaceae bacterium]